MFSVKNKTALALWWKYTVCSALSRKKMLDVLASVGMVVLAFVFVGVAFPLTLGIFGDMGLIGENNLLWAFSGASRCGKTLSGLVLVLHPVAGFSCQNPYLFLAFSILLGSFSTFLFVRSFWLKKPVRGDRFLLPVSLLLAPASSVLGCIAALVLFLPAALVRAVRRMVSSFRRRLDALIDAHPEALAGREKAGMEHALPVSSSPLHPKSRL